MDTIDDVRAAWDEHLSRTSKAVIEAVWCGGTDAEKAKATEDQLEALAGYWKFKRIMEYATKLDNERAD